MSGPAPGLLVATVAAVGVLHTIVPDHWAPIALIARREGWSRAFTARTAAIAGTGHVASTLAIALLVWWGGVAFAERFGHTIAFVSSAALVAFGGWIAYGAWRELRAEDPHEHGHGHGHEHEHEHGHGHAHGHTHAPAAAGRSKRTALLLVLGSSPMVEGIPAFFAAAPLGPGVLAAMSVAFALSTIATYVVLCVLAAAGAQHVRFGRFERYGELASGVLVMALGAVFAFI